MTKRRRRQDRRTKKETPPFAQITPRIKQSIPEIKVYKDIDPKTPNQIDYFNSIRNKYISMCYGDAGTGKTLIAVYLACKMLEYGQVKKILITRPLVQTGNGLGFLPGDLNSKILPYMIPLLDELDNFLTPYLAKQLIASNVIEMCPLETMRGRNFHDTFMCLDEAQNCDSNQIKLFLSRLGKNSKAVICGDTKQTDLNYGSGFLDSINRLRNSDYVGVTKFDKGDIQRNHILKDILGRLEA